MNHATQPADQPEGRPVPSASPTLGDVVRLRKAHPCGSDTWTVVRLGADIGLRCTGCARKVLIPRGELARRVRAVVAAGSGPSGA